MPLSGWSLTATKPTAVPSASATHTRPSFAAKTPSTACRWSSRQSGCSRPKRSEPNTRSRDAKTGAHVRSERSTTASASRSSNGRIRARMYYAPPDASETRTRPRDAPRLYVREVLHAGDRIGEDGQPSRGTGSTREIPMVAMWPSVWPSAWVPLCVVHFVARFVGGERERGFGDNQTSFSFRFQTPLSHVPPPDGLRLT